MHNLQAKRKDLKNWLIIEIISMPKPNISSNMIIAKDSWHYKICIICRLLKNRKRDRKIAKGWSYRRKNTKSFNQSSQHSN